jgi:hypothetical protein
MRLAQWLAVVNELLVTRHKMGIPLDPATGMSRVCSLSLVATSALAWDEKAMVQQQNALMQSVAGGCGAYVMMSL